MTISRRELSKVLSEKISPSYKVASWMLCIGASQEIQLMSFRVQDLKNHLRVPFWYNLSRWRWAVYAVLYNVIMKEGEVAGWWGRMGRKGKSASSNIPII